MDPRKIDTGPLEPCFWKCTSSALSPRNALREKKNAKHVFCYFTRKRLPAASILPPLRAYHCATGPPKSGRNSVRAIATICAPESYRGRTHFDRDYLDVSLSTPRRRPRCDLPRSKIQGDRTAAYEHNAVHLYARGNIDRMPRESRRSYSSVLGSIDRGNRDPRANVLYEKAPL